MKIKKIGVVDPVGANGGMDYYHFSIFKNISDRFQIFYFTSKTGNYAVENIVCFEYFKKFFNSKNNFFKFLYYFMGLLKANLNLKINNVKIVHYHFFGNNLLYVFNVLISKILFLKIVATVHDVSAIKKTFFTINLPFILKFVDIIIVHNSLTKVAILEDAPSLSGKMHIIKHGHYLDTIGNFNGKKYHRNKISIPDDAFVFLFFGQIRETKGLETAILALKIHIETNPNSLLLIAGRFIERDSLNYMKLIEENNLCNYVKIVDKYIPNDDVDDYFFGSDCILLPYREIFQSGVLLMSLSYSVPVIVSDIPGMVEIISNGINGLTFKNNDCIDLSLKMQEVTKSSELRKKVGENGYSYVQQNHDWRVISKQSLELYETLLEKNVN